ncbi:MAG TPA: polyphosphate kinase 2 family protein [Candidatus Angelobacter sp.]|nr:polyphosphate kinase 2 family protein [Candidatus Angelobacter sp.]
MKVAKKTHKLANDFEVKRGQSFRLKDFDPGETRGIHSKEKADELLHESTRALCDLQEKLYAQDRWAILLVVQAMDAAGKDSLIKHVMTGVNPQGCEVTSFKQPSAEELNHDYLWRASRRLPERGHIGVFNRSYYEEVLVVRVHQELLSRQHLPDELVSKKIWKERFEDIRNFEKYLTHNGVVIRKFFLNVSKEEQKRRFLDRLNEPEKNWKFSDADVHERQYWDDYMNAYEEMIQHTATPEAPWYVVPADHKWFTHLAVSSVVIETLKDLKLDFPKVDKERRKSLETVREALTKERN